MSRVRFLGKGKLTVGLRLTAWALRIVLGATFILSGLSKAVDPYGTFYKISDYVSVFGWNIPENVILFGAFALFCSEFVIGAMLVLGCFRRTTAICATLIMAFMLPLTLWIALSNPVSDCGCFGDAFLISNWATFVKNIGLTSAAVWLLFFNRRIHWVITPALQWLALTTCIAYPAYVGAIGYFVQPPMDFRPYKTGSEIVDLNDNQGQDDGSVELVYRNSDGKEQTFSIETAPADDSEWTFVRQEEKLSSKKKGMGRDLRVFEQGGGEEDVTADLFHKEGKALVLFMPVLSEINLSDTWPINTLYRYSLDHDIEMFAITAADEEAISVWEDMSMAEYPIYMAEDTSIKEVVRGNPALVYIDNGKIIWKQSLQATDVDALVAPDSQLDISNLAINTLEIMNDGTIGLVMILAILAIVSFLPPTYRLAKRMRRRRRMIANSSVSGHADA